MAKRAKVRQVEAKIKAKLESHWSGKVELSQVNYLQKLEREKAKVEAEARAIRELERREEEYLQRVH